ncbi:hypothetical protein TIFTF001_018632 [Ficus carica]|uniref:Uncharacterized protein n=1 Tax=Ficus carica TaxID=3494 RepID=A0AA88ANM0_FICCA|nr:hypothetical protein TIFTF001_018632 [Ficus carica]
MQLSLSPPLSTAPHPLSLFPPRALAFNSDRKDYNRDSLPSREQRRLQQESQKATTPDLYNQRLNPDHHEDVTSDSDGPFKRFFLRRLVSSFYNRLVIATPLLEATAAWRSFRKKTALASLGCRISKRKKREKEEEEREGGVWGN